MARKFFRQIFTVEVLTHNEPLGPDTDLQDLGNLSEDPARTKVHACMTLTKVVSLTSKEMAQQLIKHETDPLTFDLDINGKDLQVPG